MFVYQSPIYFFIACLALLSPLLQPYLLNPNIIPFYASSLFFMLWLAALLLKSIQDIFVSRWFLVVFLFMISSAVVSVFPPPSYTIAVLCAFIVFIVFSQRHCTVIHTVFPVFLTASVIWTSLALFVWGGWSHGDALHIGLWAFTSDAGIKPNGPFVNGNVLAIFNACAWLIATVYALKTKQWWWWLLAFLFLCCIAISMAWGAWLAMLPIIVWLLSYCFARKSYRAMLILLLSIILAWNAGNIIAGYVINHDSMGAEVRMNNAPDHGLDERKLIWLSSYTMWRNNPWFGVGLGQLPAYYLTYQSKVLDSLNVPLPEQQALNSAHNILLQLMAEIGVFGLLLWLLVTAWLVVLSWRYRMRVITSRVWPALACAWLLWIQGMGNITLSRPYPILMFALFLAIASAPSLSRVVKKITIKKHVVVLLLFVIIPCLAWTSVQKTQAWLDYEHLGDPHISNQERAAISQSLVKEPSILPYLISTMVADRMLYPDLRQSTLALEPYVQQALTLRQDPKLLQEQFYMHLLNKRWHKACTIAAILMPMKAEKDNHEAYLAACNKKMPKNFSFH